MLSKNKRHGEPRMSLAPLQRYLGVATVVDVCQPTGCARRTAFRWAATGIPLTTADEVAIRLGVHPSAIWSNWFSEERAV